MLRFWVTITLGTLILLGVSGCSELVESNYPTYQQAAQSGAIESGWLPAFLPESASNIRESHDPETNQVWVSFEFPQEEIESFAAFCTSVSYDQVTLPDLAPRWWDEKALNDPWNAFYVCGDTASLGYLAVLGTGDQAYFWSYR